MMPSMRHSARVLLAVSLAASLSFAGCKKDEVTVPKNEPVTPAEAETFARRLASALEPCDGTALLRFLDVDTIMRTAVARSSAPRSAKKGMLAGMTAQLETFASRLCGDPLSTYHLLRVRTDQGVSKALFRFLGDDGVNYLEFYIGKNEQGEVLAYDMYSFLSAELVSETMRELIDRGVKDRDLMKDPTQLTRIMAEVQAHMAANRFAEARAALATLPESLRTGHTVMLNDLQIAANMDEETYLAAIAAFEKKFPGDSSLDMVLLDGFYLRKQYDEATAAIGRLSKRIGGDPYLDALRAGILSEQGKHVAAREAVERALAAEPSLENIHWVRARIAARDKHFAEVAEVLAHLQTAFGVTFTSTDITADPDLAEFAQSAEGKAFLETL